VAQKLEAGHPANKKQFISMSGVNGMAGAALGLKPKMERNVQQ
jgi:hypothetical protein